MPVLFEDCIPRTLPTPQDPDYGHWREDLHEDPAEVPGTLSDPLLGDLGPTLHRNEV